VVFVWSWIDVLGRARGPEVTFTLLFLAFSLTIIVTATALWIAHNVALARRKEERVTVRERVTRIGTLSAPAVVHISVEGGRKMYRAEEPAAAREAA
jgi:hypothetical protein